MPPTVRLELRPEPGWSHDEHRRLAAALKCLLRSFGWRCVKVEDLPAALTPVLRNADGSEGTGGQVRQAE